MFSTALIAYDLIELSKPYKPQHVDKPTPTIVPAKSKVMGHIGKHIASLSINKLL